MVIWVVAVGEPLPVDDGAPRLLRAGQLASLMATAGHEVTWWTSSFDHMGKRQRVAETTSVKLSADLTMTMLRGCTYQSNVSLMRILSHRQVAAQFKLHAAAASRPDAIVCSYPTLELAEACVNFGLAVRCPVLLDIRDLWPDFLMEVFPSWLKPVGRAMLQPMYKQAQRALHGATGIVGITQPILDWALRKADRAQRPADFVAPLAYSNRPQSAIDLQSAHAAWTARGVGRDGRFVIALFSTISRLLDLSTVIEAARLLRGSPFTFVLAGTGDKLEHYKQMADGLDNVIFPGWIDAPAIASLMELAAVGLAPYYNEYSFTLSWPNKSIEYLAGGLPIVTCLEGALSSLVQQHGVGVVYEPENSQDLANCLRRLAGDAAGLEQMSVNAKNLYASQFVAEDVYGRYAAHIDALVAQEI